MRVPPTTTNAQSAMRNVAAPTSAPQTSPPSTTTGEAAPVARTNPTEVDQMEKKISRAEPALPPERANAKIISDFYEAFARRDGAAMAAMYHPDATFHDEAFGTLKGKEIGAMWMMLTKSSPELKVEHSAVSGTAAGGTAHWDATYPFSITGRTVKNSIDATIEVKDGKIIAHRDVFSFPKWATQAFGLERFGFFGRMIADSSLTQGALRLFARRGLKKFMEKRGIS
jgi:ketosteroid isomerase-like protein